MDLLKAGLIFGFIVMLNLQFCKGGEPQCSKFPYEEALLEKMIRMEIKVEQMQKGINEAEQKVVNELNQLKNERETFRVLSENSIKDSKQIMLEMETLSKQLVANVTNDIALKTATLDLHRRQNEAKLDRMSADVHKKYTMAAAKSTHKAIFVAKVADKLKFVDTDVIVFDAVVDNEDGVYNAKTGKFTTPVDGYYLFTTQLCATSYPNFKLAFMVDAVVAQMSLHRENGQETCKASTMMARLQVGNRVWVENRGPNFLIKDDWRWNIFSGILISPHH